MRMSSFSCQLIIFTMWPVASNIRLLLQKCGFQNKSGARSQCRSLRLQNSVFNLKENTRPPWTDWASSSKGSFVKMPERLFTWLLLKLADHDVMPSQPGMVKHSEIGQESLPMVRSWSFPL